MTTQQSTVITGCTGTSDGCRRHHYQLSTKLICCSLALVATMHLQFRPLELPPSLCSWKPPDPWRNVVCDMSLICNLTDERSGLDIASRITPCCGHPCGLDRGRSPHVNIEWQHPVLYLEILQDSDHLLEHELAPHPPHAHVLEVERVPKPNWYLQLVGVINVPEDDHSTWVPVLLLVVNVTAIYIWRS